VTVSEQLKNELYARGAALVGFAELTCLPKDARQYFDYGVAIAVSYTKEAMQENADGDPARYYSEMRALNQKLPELANFAAQFLIGAGYKALPKPSTAVAQDENLRSALPHKTIATLSGLGWIGRCAALVTREFGSAIRLVAVLTDAPLDCGVPVAESRCGDACRACRDVCPGHAVKGPKWHRSLEREAFYDAFNCRDAARARARATLGVDETVCGLCIAYCPFTRQALGYYEVEDDV